MAAILPCTGGIVRVTRLPDGRHRISVEPKPGIPLARSIWETSYPLALIREMHAAKGLYVCDEIMREEDPRYVEHFLRHEVLGYVDAADFAGKQILEWCLRACCRLAKTPASSSRTNC